MKKSEINKLDDIWRDKVKERVNYKCEYGVDCSGRVNAHHIFGRRSFSVRWNLNNGACLCAKHHTFDSKFSAHQTPTIFTDWIKEKRGEDWYNDLVFRHNQIYKGDYEEVLKSLNEKLI